MADTRYPEVEVQLTGTDGNAFAVLGAVQRALRRHGVDPAPYMTEATEGDYDHLLRTTMQWVSVS